MTHIQLLFSGISSDQSEQLIAALNEAGFEGFEEGENELKAYIQSCDFDEAIAGEIAQQSGVHFSKTIIEETNWNEVWESNFQPVIVDDFVAVRAGFHEPIPNVKQEIVITPKMSFGTGHHATTHMMIRQMESIDFSNKTVFDFGTGTGILSILAHKLGASSVLALDNDDWSIANAQENVLYNQADSVIVRKADSVPVDSFFDIILANINKHVILENLPAMVNQLNTGGILVISGILISDENDILVKTRSLDLRVSRRFDRHNWLCLSLSC